MSWNREEFVKAKQISKATGKDLNEVIKALREHPESATPSSATASKPSTNVGPQKFHETSFWKAIDERMLKRGESYRIAYHAVRKESPDLWEQMIEAVNA